MKKIQSLKLNIDNAIISPFTKAIINKINEIINKVNEIINYININKNETNRT